MILAIVTGIVACALPLLRTLGYESAMLIAVFAGALAMKRGLAGGCALRSEETPAEGDPPGPAAADSFSRAGRTFARSTLAPLAAAAVPFLMVAVATRLVQGCRLGPGTQLALFLVPPATAHLAATGLLTGALFRTRTARIGFLAALAALHVWHLGAQALAPRMIPLSIPLGFVSLSGWGGVGAADIDLPARYFLLRGLAVAVCPLLTGLAALAAGSRARGGLRRPGGRSAVLLALACLPIVAAAARPGTFGLNTGVATREAALSVEHATSSIRLRTTPGGPASAAAAEMASDAEWDFQVASALMGLAAPAPVTVWVYDSDEQMKELTGAANFLFALPWRREIHTVQFEGGAVAMRHELVHALASEWTTRPLGIAWNQALVEGTAEAVASCRFCGEDFQSRAAAVLEAGHLAPAPRLFSTTGFAWGAGALHNSYFLAGSFIGFAVERHGAQALARAYGGDTWNEAFGSDLDTLDEEWRRMLETIPVSREAVERVRASFDPRRHPPFFRRRCPRVGVARSRRSGGNRKDRARGGADGAGAARGLAEAARRSLRVSDAQAAAAALLRENLDGDAVALVQDLVEESDGQTAQGLDLRKVAFLTGVAAERIERSREQLERLEAGIALSRRTADLYRMILESEAGSPLARALLEGTGSPEGRRLLRRALGTERSGPAALIAAEVLCAWPPRGTDPAGPRLLATFVSAGRPGSATAGAALKLGRLALREGRTKEAAELYAIAFDEATDPSRRLEAAEGIARASRLSGAEFVRGSLPLLPAGRPEIAGGPSS